MLTRCRLCVRSIMHATVSKSPALIFFHGLFRRLLHTVDMCAMIRKAFVQVFLSLFILVRRISCLCVQAVRLNRRYFLLFPHLFFRLHFFNFHAGIIMAENFFIRLTLFRHSVCTVLTESHLMTAAGCRKGHSVSCGGNFKFR